MNKTRTGRARSAVCAITSLIILSLITGEWSGTGSVMAHDGKSPTLISQPDSDVEFAIDLAGFKIERDRLTAEGRRYIGASHPATGMNVAIAMEQVKGLASTGGCITHLRQLKQGPTVSRGIDVALSTSRDMPTLEYTLRRYQGIRLDQKSLYACMAHANVYAHIHVSKLQYTDADASLFQRLVRTFRLEKGASARMRAQRPETGAPVLFVGTTLSATGAP